MIDALHAHMLPAVIQRAAARPLLEDLPPSSFTGSRHHDQMVHSRSVMSSHLSWHSVNPSYPTDRNYITVDLLRPYKVFEIHVRGRGDMSCTDASDCHLIRSYRIVTSNFTRGEQTPLKFTGVDADRNDSTVYHQRNTTHVNNIVRNSAFEPFIARYVTMEVLSWTNTNYFSLRWELIGIAVPG